MSIGRCVDRPEVLEAATRSPASLGALHDLNDAGLISCVGPPNDLVARWLITLGDGELRDITDDNASGRYLAANYLRRRP